ncbi:hypothetical protein LMH87_011609 [Akanthomyces muscarius]|uniref:Amino acid permease/ SLC12A domain-containing protein n=1 Tax=Akanthomyces muscarius TaxID=2231603 RepID=A0A9W8QA24_AKAMU|nr:hypothetical protein LMH87_011609 [Akanthomyces muscarius]KAJ4150880.1 hypothetical protein LMH87_011609 [Akanthomyces muscarius]
MSDDGTMRVSEEPMGADPANSRGEMQHGHAAAQTRLKNRHLYMIAMGGCIGTAYLVGSGRTLSRGGPALALAGFVTTSATVWVFATLMFEMAACMPLHGAGADTYATRLLSRSFGFAMGWNYWYAYAMLVPFEVTAATLVVGYWSPPVPDAVLITILVVAVAGLNYLPVGHSGEAEFVFSSLKLGMLTGIMVLSVVVAAGGGPTGDRLAFRYWRDPGPANPWLVAGGKGELVSFIGVLVSVVLPLSFLGEMVAMCGGETEEPRRTIPRASRALLAPGPGRRLSSLASRRRASPSWTTLSMPSSSARRGLPATSTCTWRRAPCTRSPWRATRPGSLPGATNGACRTGRSRAARGSPCSPIST